MFESMDWKKLISELRDTGMSQKDIGDILDKTQGWVWALENGHYKDVKWADGEALRKLHAERCQKVKAS